MTALREADGRMSFSRSMGAACVIVLLAVFIYAAAASNWETVRALAVDVSLLAAGLYGFNKFSGAMQGKQKERQ